MADILASVLNVYPHACLYIYSSWYEVMKAYKSILWSGEREKLISSIKKLVHQNSLITLSARTAFDLWLTLNKFPKGSEILLTAVNIPDMLKVIREHGLIPVPVDITYDTLFSTGEQVEKAITSKTVAVLVAQLYGKRNNIADIHSVTQKLNLPLIEDLAEGWSGPAYNECGAMADLTLFSFGPIKFNTAFGGGIVVVKDDQLFKRMEDLHKTYTIRDKSEMFSKLNKYMMALILLNVPFVTGTLMKLCMVLGIDHKSYVVAMLRGFPDHFFEKLRQQPDAGLLSILEDRIATFSKEDLGRSEFAGTLLTNSLYEAEMKLIKEESKKKNNNRPKVPILIVPGQACPHKNYWLYPLLVQDPAKTMAGLNKIGIDSYRGATQLNLVDRPAEYKDMPTPPVAKQIMDHTIYIPVHKNVSENLIKKMAVDIAKIAREINTKPVFPHNKYISIKDIETLRDGKIASSL